MEPLARVPDSFLSRRMRRALRLLLAKTRVAPSDAGFGPKQILSKHASLRAIVFRANTKHVHKHILLHFLISFPTLTIYCFDLRKHSRALKRFRSLFLNLGISDYISFFCFLATAAFSIFSSLFVSFNSFFPLQPRFLHFLRQLCCRQTFCCGASHLARPTTTTQLPARAKLSNGCLA